MRKAWIAFGLAGAMLAFGAGLVVAGGANHPRDDVGTTALETSKGVQGGCGMGAATNTNTFTPDDDNTAEANNTALQVTFNKNCGGPVLAQFQAEMATSAGGFIHADAIAKCMGSGCVVGQERFADPGHTFLQTQSSAVTETHGMVFVFHQVPPGKWQYRIGVGGNGSSSVEFRGLAVEAFQKP